MRIWTQSRTRTDCPNNSDQLTSLEYASILASDAKYQAPNTWACSFYWSDEGHLRGRTWRFLSLSFRWTEDQLSTSSAARDLLPRQTTYTVVIVVIIPAATIAQRYTLAITEHIVIITLTALCALFCLLTKGRGKNVIACWRTGGDTVRVIAVGWTGPCCVGEENRTSIIKYI